MVKKKSQWIKALIGFSTILCLGTPMTQVYASDDTSVISIEKPEGWQNSTVEIKIGIDGRSVSNQFSVSKIEAKVGAKGTWQDITESQNISIAENTTVYVRVTDAEGNTYEQNRSIKCYDNEKPTLAAALTDGVLTIQGNDTISGIASIQVNGTTFANLTDGKLRIQLTQADMKTKKIEMTATDNAGNVSSKYSLQNPYYGWTTSKSSGTGTSGSGLTTTDSVEAQTTASGISTSTSGENQTTTPLPQAIQASEPTSATGTVSEKTTEAVEATTGEQVDNVEQKTESNGKVFYTITTKSGKTFYLIVDNTKTDNNVYLLTEVSEQDLMNFTQSDTLTLPSVDTVYAEEEKEEVKREDLTDESTESDKEEVKMPESKGTLGTYIFIGLIVLAVGGTAYYFKVYKPKHEFDDEDEYEGDEFEEEDDEPEFIDLDDEDDEIPEEDED